MADFLHKHRRNFALDKAGDNFNENGELSTSLGDFDKLFIFHGHIRSRAAHSFQT